MNTVSGMRCERHKLVEHRSASLHGRTEDVCVGKHGGGEASDAAAAAGHTSHKKIAQISAGVVAAENTAAKADSATQYLPLELIIQTSWGKVQEQSEQQREELARAAPACRKIIS